MRELLGLTWLLYTCDMSHTYVRTDLFICVTWLNRISIATQHIDNSSMCVTWLIHICDMTHASVRHDLFTCVTWLNRTWAIKQHINRSFISVTRLLYVCDMTHIYVRRDELICMTLLNRTSAIKQHIDKSFPPHADGSNDGKWWNGGEGKLRRVGWAVGNRMGCPGPFL